MHRRRAIISIYTGGLIGSISEVCKYAEKLLGRPVSVQEFLDEEFCQKLKELVERDYMLIKQGIILTNMVRDQ